ncbi:unnamed protein product [Adineta ricciae]|uniref:Proline dehydrogenase n=1 Tax=Adineta ricciae TaxID=249248 RepID=A0A814C0C8_ADIRI|nr:unnamed protein product [Adineta ricciae]CAF1457377.1 unnamed protein product [Adineta ricciae]
MLKIKHFCPTKSTICLCRRIQFFPTAISHVSTTSIPNPNGNQKQETRPDYPFLDTKFNQYQIAYRYRHTIELLRGYFVYRLFSINFLVNNQNKIAYWGRRILGEKVFHKVLKLTAFGHFVGGESPQEIIPVINRLQKYHVHPILDYSVESDDTNSTASSDHVQRMHDDNTAKFIECIKTSHDICGANNLIAIKVTALIRPSVLKKLNTVLQSINNREVLPALFEIINQDETSGKTVTRLQQSLQLQNTTDQKEISSSVRFTTDELKEIYQLLLRLNKIAQACAQYKISIMVDAEQTYFQNAINYLATELQRYYNKNNIPFIYGTYQCYLKETLICLKRDLALAEKYNYIFAAKLVRGAYMEQERRLARENSYEDPINANFETTTQMYHVCFDEVMKSTVKRSPNQVRVMVASHNEDTIRYAITKMKDYDIRRGSSIVSFASLYGMSDYVAFALANSGYKTYKYLPYGPIEALQPYLFRRAQENRAIFQKADKDRRFHLQAFKDRIFKSTN